MRRIGRWMLNALTGLSLMLCIATVTLWLKSHQLVGYWYGTQTLTIHGRRDALFVEHYYPYAGKDTESFKADVVSFAGFMYYTGLESSTRFPGIEYEAFSEYRAEYPSLLAVTAPLPALRLLLLLRWIVRRRSVAGRCPQCRYDLTGNLSGVCPECGRKIAEVE